MTVEKPVVTAVGRLLKKGSPKVHKVIAINDEGKVRTVLYRPVD